MKTVSIILGALVLVAFVLSGQLAPRAQAVGRLEETPVLGPPTFVTPIASEPPGEIAQGPDFPGVPAAGEPAAVTPIPTAAVRGPDGCEPNDTPERACALPLDAISGPFTIVPEEDRDFFRLDLPQEASLQTEITVRATAGLDLAIAVSQNGAVVASGSLSLTLEPSITGPIVLRVENRDPRLAGGESYRIEVRRSIVPASAAPDAVTSADTLENNWSFDTAASIAVGVVYDLTFVCPEQRPGACPGGDHDYLVVPVKAGVPYLAATFDLALGVDTVVELFWNREAPATAASDDYAPGGMLSALRWVAPADGLLAIRIAPRNGGLVPQLSTETPAGYRFAIAPAASELGRKLDGIIRDQANVPAPTTTAAPAASSGQGASGGTGNLDGASPRAGTNDVQETIAAGPAVVVRDTVLRREPRDGATALADLAPETSVTVRGPVSGLWVNVETEASILPGWVRWSDLRRSNDGAAGPLSSTPDASTSPISQQPGVATRTATSVSTQPTGQPGAASPEVNVTPLDPVLPEAAPSAPSRVPFTISVLVLASDRPPPVGTRYGLASPTPDRRQAVSGVRVQLVNVFGDLLAEGPTDQQGEVQLSRDVRAGDELRIRIPVWGVELTVPADRPTISITVPEEQP
jgi:hypothetical protein